MNGLDKIIERILSESDSECNEILKTAQSECEKIRLENEETAARIVSELKEANDADLLKIVETGRQKAETDGKKKLLNAQQSLVFEVIKEAEEKLSKLPVNEYFNALAKLLTRYSGQRTGEILLSNTDIQRMPVEFKAELDRQLLTVEADEKLGGGGFVLRYGEIEENCTFTALLTEKQETIHDKVYSILFR